MVFFLFSEAECINVTTPLQALVSNSELRIVGKTEYVRWIMISYIVNLKQNVTVVFKCKDMPNAQK